MGQRKRFRQRRPGRKQDQQLRNAHPQTHWHRDQMPRDAFFRNQQTLCNQATQGQTRRPDQPRPIQKKSSKDQTEKTGRPSPPAARPEGHPTRIPQKLISLCQYFQVPTYANHILIIIEILMVQCILSRYPILRLVHQKSIQQIIGFHRAQILIARIDKIWPVNFLIPNKKNFSPKKNFFTQRF
jgi:hypothetical protein